jgi:hypothetical protein
VQVLEHKRHQHRSQRADVARRWLSCRRCHRVDRFACLFLQFLKQPKQKLNCVVSRLTVRVRANRRARRNCSDIGGHNRITFDYNSRNGWRCRRCGWHRRRGCTSPPSRRCVDAASHALCLLHTHDTNLHRHFDFVVRLGLTLVRQPIAIQRFQTEPTTIAIGAQRRTIQAKKNIILLQ